MGLSFILYLLAVIFVLIGIAGIILPALPGIPLVFIGLLLAAWADGFAHVGWPTLVALGVLTVLSLLVDVLATGGCAAGRRQPQGAVGSSAASSACSSCRSACLPAR
jgi:uncharacterized protein YqgC (DUF456 family)